VILDSCILGIGAKRVGSNRMICSGIFFKTDSDSNDDGGRNG
jgi:hypothetical protein